VRAALLAPLMVLASTALAEAPPFVVEAIARTSPGARATVTEYRPTLPAGCAATGAVALASPDLSGRLMLRLSGTAGSGGSCDGFATARAQLLGPVYVVTKAVARGAPLADAVTVEERPVQGLPSRVNDLTPGATAAQTLPPGTVLEVRHVAAQGPKAGDKVTIVLRSGAITLTQEGRLAPCIPGRSCAVLPTGRRVEGQLVDGRLVVEVR
jgi:hypothetical protein